MILILFFLRDFAPFFYKCKLSIDLFILDSYNKYAVLGKIAEYLTLRFFDRAVKPHINFEIILYIF